MHMSHVEECSVLCVKFLITHETGVTAFLDAMSLYKMLPQMFEIEEGLVALWTVFQPRAMVIIGSLDNGILFNSKMIHHRYHGDIFKAAAFSWTAPSLILGNVILKIVTFIF